MVFSKVFKIQFICVALSIIYIGSNYSHAQSLENVLASKELRSVAKSSKPKIRKFLTTGTNFSKVFRDNPEKMIAGWMGTSQSAISEIRFVDHHSRQRVTHLSYLQWYKNFYTNREATVEILIPRPDAVASVVAGLDPDFSRLKSPALKADNITTHEVGDRIATLMLDLADNSALLLIPIERNGIIKITTSKWQDREMLLEVAKSINIKRLNQKLLS